MPKTLLFHDTFLMKGGAERMNIEIAKILNADIATAKWSKDSYDPVAMGFLGKILEVNRSWKRGGLGYLIMKFNFFLSGSILKGYERILFSNEAITAIWATPKGKKTYYYAHSISRHLFDQYDDYLAKVPKILKPAYKGIAKVLKRLYIAELGKVGTIFVNSIRNKERMKDWIGREDAIVLYPPVDTTKFAPIDKKTVSRTLAIEGVSLYYKEYYISFSRLMHAKRIDAIIEAFKRTPKEKVLILYGKNDTQKEELFALAAGYDNIVFRVLSDNENLPILINGAIASISISKDEDFGMVAIESMACSVPVIAVNSGGYRETILAGRTGILMPEDDVAGNLVKALTILNKIDWGHMTQRCVERARDFSLERFKEQLLNYIKD